MTISEDTVKSAILQYHREYDRYLKLSSRVAEICRFEIVESNAIRAQVTFRAKSPKSLGGKLSRSSAWGEKDLLSVPSGFDLVRDLAADALTDGFARLRWFAARFQEPSKVESGGIS